MTRWTRRPSTALGESAHARVVMVSSAVGSHGDPHFGLGLNAGVPVCGVSKAALKGSKILENAACPGFTATQPGMAERGARPIADGAAGVEWAYCVAPIPWGGPERALSASPITACAAQPRQPACRVSRDALLYLAQTPKGSDGSSEFPQFIGRVA